MKNLLIGILLSFYSAFCWAQTNTAITTGAWETGANWSLGHAPLSTEDVVVPSTYTMTVNASDVCLSLTINSGGDVTINGAQNLSIAGAFSNAGSFIASNSGATITFNAASNSIVSGAGTYTIAGTIVLDMGATATSLDVQSSAFCAALTGSFTLTQGTWIMDNAGSVANMYTNNSTTKFIIPNTVIIQSNQGIMYLGNNATANNLLLEGELFMNGGRVYVGASQGYNAGIDFQYHVVGGISPILNVVSGNLLIFAGFNANTGSDYINFNMSGGDIYVAYSVGNSNGGWSYYHTFQLQDVVGGQTVMSGGTIVLQDACDAYCFDLDMGGANVATTLYSVTGGVVQLGYLNTQGGASWFAVEPEPTTNYPTLDFESGTAKKATPWTASNVNFMAMNINASMTWDCTQFNNNVTYESNYGSYTLNDQGILNSGTGTYTFDGSVSQVIEGASTINLGKLAINNSGTGVFLQTPVTLSGGLTLTNGLLTTSATDILTLIAGTTSTPGNASSFVNGPMAKIGNTAFTFPIGSSSRWMPIGMTAPATLTNKITASYTFATPTNPTSLNAPLTSVSNYEYWTMNESVLTDPVTVTLHWQSAVLSAIPAYNMMLHVADYTGGAWTDLGQSALTGVYPGAGTVTAATTIVGFTNLPVTFGYSPTNPLPVTLTSFTADYTSETKSVLTNWTVETQLNNKEFIVEKTLDGTNYQDFATVAGAGTTPFTMSYSAIDPNPTPGYSYYRLKQIDMDGNETVFAPVAIYIPNGQNNNSLSLYPNPVNSAATLNYTSTDDNNLSVEVINASGQIVNSFVMNNIHIGENTYALNASVLSPGLYVLRATGTKEAYTIKFIKQ